ncbi:LysR family transcriptional regulator [Brevibacterium permense]|uniref:LysR family transcriptional regulator n=1 Tax=Brevibacterium permense TaxID=234834 RepID=UPI0021D00988|nr:LysR family transcriptional regulator [Brevibacterium permense]MCU4298788.1 LysR family transcriptional regulator [Brevibacterium permense]
MPDFDAIPPALPMRFTLRQVECFLAVAETGSFSSAAQSIRASDSAVADSITAMERSLGVELFRRQRSRGATLTSDGLTVLPFARRLAADGAELMTSVGHHANSIVGPVRIGITNTLASITLPHLIVEVEKRYPDIRIDYRIDDLTSLLVAADRAEVDLVVTFDLGMPPEYHRRSLGVTEAMIVLAEDHPLASRKRIALIEIADEPMILLDIVASRTYTLELMSSQGITPRVIHRTADYELCRSLVGRGVGYTLLMRRNVSTETWDGQRVVYVPIDPPPRPIDILVTWPRDPLPPRVNAVIDTAVDLGGEIGRIMGE